MLSEKTVAGVFLGKVERIKGQNIWLSSKMNIEPGFRLRFHIPGTAKQETERVREEVDENGLFKLHSGGKQVKPNSEVYLAGISDVKFPSKLDDTNAQFKQLKYDHKQKILSALKGKESGRQEELYFRINTMEWLKKMNRNDREAWSLDF